MIKIMLPVVLGALILSGLVYKGVDVFYLVVVLTGAYLFFTKKIKLTYELKVFYALSLIFVFIAGISIVRTDWHLFFEWRFSAFQLLLFMPLIAVFNALIFKSESLFWKTLISSSLFTVVWLILLYLNWPVTRDTGLLSDAINRGNMGMLFGLIALVSLFAVVEKHWKLLAFLGFICGVILSLLSGSKGGWLALFISFITMTFVFYRYKKYAEFKILFSMQILLVLLIAVFWQYLPIEKRLLLAVKDFNNYFEGTIDGSVGIRFELWKAAYYAFLEKPILGWGWGEFNHAHSFVMQSGNVAETRLTGHPHNQYFLFLAELGFIGLLSFMAFITWPLIVAIRYIKQNQVFQNKVHLALLVIVVTESVLEFSLSDDSFSQKYFIFVFLFITSFALFKMQDKKIK